MTVTRFGTVGRALGGAVLLRRLLTIGLSVGARGLFGLVLATVIVSRYSAVFSVEFFQLLLLQSVFLTFVSGSGYAHAVAAGESEEGGIALVRNYLLFALIALVATAAAELLLPRSFVARAISPDGWKINLLIVGGVAISLHGILQGVIVERVGTFRTFLPTSLAGLAAAVAVLVLHRLPSSAMFAVFVGYQVGSLLLLLVCNPVAARILFDAARWRNGSTNALASARIFGIALINTAYLLIFYAYRQSWSGQVPAVQSQGAFFGLRLSDVYLQILVLGAARSNPLRLRGIEPLSFFAKVAAFGLLVALFTVLVVFGVLHASGWMPLIVSCVIAQLLSEFLRIPGSLANQAVLQTGSPAYYALSCLAPIMMAYGACMLAIRPVGLNTIYLFQLLVAGLQVSAYCLIGIANARRAASAI